ncbi:MAG: hypothetical protein HLX50_16400 [Alteromonadaceae bacterium]|nr:hypothetical protein [Alteromonadaceae bacterium]
MTTASRDPYSLVWANRLVMLVVLFNLAAISAFPVLQDFWRSVGTCDSGFCGVVISLFTHWTVTYAAYLAMVGFVAKEWFLGRVQRRLKINAITLLGTLLVLGIFFVLFNLPMIGADPL